MGGERGGSQEALATRQNGTHGKGGEDEQSKTAKPSPQRIILQMVLRPEHVRKPLERSFE